jgi:uncharacterized protein YjbI with pentapeptide repeats
MIGMSEDRDARTEEQNTPRSWQPTSKQVFWVIGVGLALEALAMLVVNFYPDTWETLSRPWVAALIGIGVALTVLIVLLAIGGASYGWTGFGEKTLWEWLQLLSALAIPIVLAGAGFWFTMQQDARQRVLAEQRAQDEALQGYLDQMGTLVLENLSDQKVQTVMRARTLTALSRLDTSRKNEVVQFLLEANLVNSAGESGPVIDLSHADLSDTELSNDDLTGAILRNADLRGADLRHASLEDASLWAAHLNRANLRGAYLTGATLVRADFNGAKLDHANLSDAKLEEGGLQNIVQNAASLKGATMPNGQKYEDWRKSNGSGEDGENSGPA